MVIHCECDLPAPDDKVARQSSSHWRGILMIRTNFLFLVCTCALAMESCLWHVSVGPRLKLSRSIVQYKMTHRHIHVLCWMSPMPTQCIGTCWCSESCMLARVVCHDQPACFWYPLLVRLANQASQTSGALDPTPLPPLNLRIDAQRV